MKPTPAKKPVPAKAAPVKAAPAKARAVVSQRDKFVPFLVAFAFVTLIGVAISIYFYWHNANKKPVSDSYLTLPEMVIDSDTQVVRLKVAIEVDGKDGDWVQTNKSKINQVFKEAVQEVDTDDFRNHDGCQAIQTQLKDQLNKQLKIDKIQGILYQDLLMQYK
ncbi:flagellar basal body-associated FliL family protein [Sapientia aquatica]|uniref:Flagellar protein FliL n=1 Tax=Sapientia aquatica TaxID=1549640 RepID=A0A4R5W401_9BURK|nr:flagellar basal body-associated FliL family protein [Sapientia aquatica]TDK67322.1 flagellar basal body-associated FliL family protein [Sapientia aquatica]